MSSKSYRPIMHHVGFWVCAEDLDKTLGFFESILQFEPLSRGPRKTGGERVFLTNPARQFVEILVADNVDTPQYRPPHPRGRVRGVAHLCFAIDDAIVCKNKLLGSGYDIEQEVPVGLGGFVSSDMGEHKILFLEGPAGISFELFEFKREAYPLGQIADHYRHRMTSCRRALRPPPIWTNPIKMYSQQ